VLITSCKTSNASLKHRLKVLAPGNTSLRGNSARVQSSIVGIRRLGEELVAKNVDRIKRSNEGTFTVDVRIEISISDWS
jgi:hypothetical protein